MVADGRARRLEELFHEALELPASSREAFLEDACAGDDELHRGVRELLAADEQANGFMAQAAIAAFPKLADPQLEHVGNERSGSEIGDELCGSVIGGFRITRRLARGGMGTVYEALQDEPERTVALKVLRPELSSPSLLKRFQHESAILARLQHPGIAHVYDAGLHESGGARLPYMAMELIPDAATITEFATRRGLDLRSRIELFVQICDAVHHSHQKGIIHRDLKPANVLVGADGVPKVIDFGISREIDSALTTFASTEAGGLLGTLAYMSPEQCDGRFLDLDLRCDVYSLGMLLHELVCGELPYDVSQLSIPQAAARICSDAPRRPTTHGRRLRGDLETILRKALEKERERRYESAAALAADLRRFLDDRPIEARPPSLAYQMRLLARRNKNAAAFLALLLVTLVAGTVVSLRLAFVARQQRESAVAARQREARRAANAAVSAAHSALRAFDVQTASRHLASVPPTLRRWEWHHLQSRLDRSSATLHGPGRFVRCANVAFDPTGERLATAWMRDWESKEGEPLLNLVVFEPKSGRELLRLPDSAAGAWALSFDPTGEELIWGGVVAGFSRLRWTTGEIVRVAGTVVPSELRFREDRPTFLCAGANGTLTEHAYPGCEVIASWDRPRDPLYCVAADRAGRWIAAAGRERVVEVWDSKTRRELHRLTGHESSIRSIDFSPDGSVLLAGGDDRTVRAWEMPSGRALGVLTGHAREVMKVRHSSDGSCFLSATAAGDWHLWKASDRTLITTFHGHGQGELTAAFHPSSLQVATGGYDGTAKLWDAAHADEHVVLGPFGALVRSICFSPDGHWIAGASFDQTVRMFRLDDGELVREFRGHELPVMDVAFDPSGDRLASASNDGTVRLWDAETGDCVATLRGHTKGVHTVAFRRDGRRIASGSMDATVLVRDATTLEVLQTLPHEDWLWSVEFSPDGKTLATASRDGQVRLWEVESGRLLRSFPHSSEPRCVAFDEAGGRLVSGAADGAVTVFDLESGATLFAFRADRTEVQGVCFTPDDERVVATAFGGAVRLWDAENGDELLTLASKLGWANGLAISPDGATLAAGGGTYDGFGCGIELWTTSPRR